MASPLRWFRKHSFFFIVVFGVFLMAIFGLGSVISGLNPGDLTQRAKAENKVVAEWSGGELKEYDLFVLRQRHFAVRRFLNHVYQFAVKENNDKPFPVAVQRILPIEQPGTKPTADEMDEQMLNRYLFAKRAGQEGFIVDENMVFEYIAQFGGDVDLSKNLLKQLNRQINPQIGLTQIVRQLQLELLSQQMESLTRGGLPFDSFNPVSVTAINPTEAIQLYARTNQRIECQVLPIDVDEYINKVTDEPSETELRELYEQGKYQYPSYNFEEPGFKVLKQARIQYFVAELESFLQNEIAKLTDEEVQAEYDRLVAADDDFVMEVVEDESEKDAADAVDAAKSADSDEDQDPAPAPDNNEDEMTEDTESNVPDSEGDEPVDIESDEIESDNADSDDGGDETPGGGEKTNTVVKQESEKQESDKQEPDPVDDSKSESTADNTLRDEQDNQNADKLAAESDINETSTNDAQLSDKQETVDAPEVQTGDTNDPVMEDEPKKRRRPKPLKDIAEALKRQMKMEAARIARDDAIDSAEKELRKYQMQQNKWEYEKKDESAIKPTPPDFKKIADALQIQFVETELINQTQIGDEQIGKIVTFSFANQRLVQNNIGEQIFEQYEATPIYQPTKVDDGAKSSKVMYWLAEKVDQNVPEYDAARETIVAYWKRSRAVELATLAGQRIADEINESGKFLRDLYPEKAVDTGVFSWFSTFGQFAYGKPVGVVDPGEEFMSTAFSLNDKQAGVALNETRNTVYVIQQNTPFVMSLDQIGSDYIGKNFFQSKRIPQEVISAKGLYRQRLNYDWLRELQETMEVKVVGQ